LWPFVVIALAGCGGDGHSGPEPDCRPLVHAQGFQGCREGRFLRRVEQSDGTLVAGPLGPLGFYRTAMLSPGRRTLLVQWSGECEIQHAFFVFASGGRPRVVTGERDWTAAPDSEALGWRGRRAVVRLPIRGEAQAGRPGVYLIDPQTLTQTRIRTIRGRQGC
jgi:hypothetical protein